ncbi:hypothetical protein PGTUg99_037746 [Puccinia graminis f. sp. tritici]|uniref:Uncharacterized protein n=1 Tax=Puccinia graminis f. sp. tritici TaxID=56615 RepID=A0A5B0RA72_PUCGR|nr:hypothetical protein PGTUg99_037746 [Puccinia graminis f. sp. tritici]
MKADHQHQLSDPSQWNASLAELPARQSEDGVIPAFFFSSKANRPHVEACKVSEARCTIS